MARMGIVNDLQIECIVRARVVVLRRALRLRSLAFSRFSPLVRFARARLYVCAASESASALTRLRSALFFIPI